MWRSVDATVESLPHFPCFLSSFALWDSDPGLFPVSLFVPFQGEAEGFSSRILQLMRQKHRLEEQ